MVEGPVRDGHVRRIRRGMGELTTGSDHREGVTMVDFVATDAAGNVKTTFATVSIDNTAPVVTVAKTPSAEFAKSDVTIGVDVTDTGGSPIVSRWYTIASDPNTIRPLDLPVSAEGTTEVTGFAMDAAGNVGQSTPATVVKIDKTPPVPTLTVSSNVAAIGSSVTADFSCADSFSLVASCVLNVDDAPFSATPGQVTLPATLTPHTYTLAVTSTDVAGNQSDPTKGTATVDFKQFALGPFVTLSSPQVTVGGSVTATWGCASAAAGVASCKLTLDGALISSTPGQVVLPAQQVGPHAVAVTATSLTGATETAGASYTAVAAAPKYTVCYLGYNPTHGEERRLGLRVQLQAVRRGRQERVERQHRTRGDRDQSGRNPGGADGAGRFRSRRSSSSSATAPTATPSRRPDCQRETWRWPSRSRVTRAGRSTPCRSN